MKNADKPINAIIQSTTTELGLLQEVFTPPSFSGLTKREYFAAMAMVGLCNNANSPSFIAELSVKLADRLLEKLEKPTE